MRWLTALLLMALSLSMLSASDQVWLEGTVKSLEERPSGGLFNPATDIEIATADGTLYVFSFFRAKPFGRHPHLDPVEGLVNNEHGKQIPLGIKVGSKVKFSAPLTGLTKHIGWLLAPDGQKYKLAVWRVEKNKTD